MTQNSQENTWVAGLQLYLKRDSGKVFSLEFCEISKNTFFTEQLRAAASKVRFALFIPNIKHTCQGHVLRA